MEKTHRYRDLNVADEKRARNPRNLNGFFKVLLFYVLPFIVINGIIFYAVTAQPEFEVNVADTDDYLTTSVEVKIDSVFPRSEFFILLDDEILEYTETDKNVYTAQIDHNGTLAVSLTYKNGMNKTVYENISCIDDEPPIITEDDSATGYMSIYADDTQSGVAYDMVYAIDAEGNRTSPSLIDEGEGLLVFNFDSDSLEVHVFDKVGHESIATFDTTYVKAGETA